MTEKFMDKLTKLVDGDESVVEGTENIGGVEIPMISMPEMSEEILERAEFAPGYYLEKLLITPRSADKPFKHERVVSASEEYVGTPERAEFLIHKRGINPQAIDGKGVCSIGFCGKELKWYGWSHRAIYGFGIGDTVKEGDCCASSGWTDEYLAEHPEEDTSLPVGFEAKTLDDAKRMAVAFAESVG